MIPGAVDKCRPQHLAHRLVQVVVIIRISIDVRETDLIEESSGARHFGNRRTVRGACQPGPLFIALRVVSDRMDGCAMRAWRVSRNYAFSDRVVPPSQATRSSLSQAGVRFIGLGSDYLSGANTWNSRIVGQSVAFMIFNRTRRAAIGESFKLHCGPIDVPSWTVVHDRLLLIEVRLRPRLPIGAAVDQDVGLNRMDCQRSMA